MRFDPTFQHPLPPTLPKAAVEATRRVIAERRAAGLAVQFVRDDGALDEWQFSTLAQRDAFTSRLPGAFAISGGDR